MAELRSFMEVVGLIQDFFVPAGIEIEVIPVAEFCNTTGFRTVKGSPDEWTVRFVGRKKVQITEETPLGFLVHEILHLLTARPAWDESLGNDTYNWANVKLRQLLIAEDVMYVGFGRYITDDVLKISDELSMYDYIYLDHPLYNSYCRGYSGPKAKCNDLLIDCNMVKEDLKHSGTKFFQLTGIFINGTVVGPIDMTMLRNNMGEIWQIPLFKNFKQNEEYMGLRVLEGSDAYKSQAHQQIAA